MSDFIVAVVFIVIVVVAFLAADKQKDEREANAKAWLEERDCKRTSYHGDSLRGIYACPDGTVYMLRDVPGHQK